MKKLIQTLIFILDALLWAFWVLIVARTFPAYGDVFFSLGKPLTPLASVFVAIGQAINWGPLLLLVQLGPMLLVAALLRPQLVDPAKRLGYSLRLLAALIILWSFTLSALLSVMDQM